MKYSLVAGAILFATTGSLAQNLLGISTSRYGGTNRLYVNPALAADSPSKFYLNIATANAHVNNNFVRYQAPFSLLRLISGNVPNQYKSVDGSLRFAVDYTKETLDGKSKSGTIWGEVRGPSFLIKTSPRSAFAVTTRFRAMGQVVGATEPLLSAIRAGLNDGLLYSIPSSDNQLAANTNTYSELGMTYASTILEGDGHKLLVGATVKLLLGYNAQHLINRGMDYRIVADPTLPGSTYLDVTRLDATLGYTTFLQNRSLSLGRLLSPSAPGRGIGADIGLTYVSQYDADSPALRIGAALTDLGGLRYTGSDYTYGGTLDQPIRFNGREFDNVNGTTQIAQVIQAKLNTGRSPDRGYFRAGLPTSLNLTLDYQAPDGLGLNVTLLQDVRRWDAVAVHQPSLLAVTPRYDRRWLSLALPVAYLNRGLTAGGMVRVGPAWLGTDNFLGLIGTNGNGIKPRGLDIYAGVAFGLGRVDE